MKLTLLSAVIVLQYLALSAADRCSVTVGNQVSQFKTARQFRVQMPCKYRLVRQTCGDFMVFLTVGQTFMNPAYEVDYVWLWVIHRESRRFWRGQTSGHMINDYIDARDLNASPFKSHPGNYTFSDLFTTKITNSLITVTDKSHSFKLELKAYKFTKDKQSRVAFECYNDKDNKTSYPRQFCGSGTKKDITDSLDEYKFEKNEEQLMFVLDALTDDDLSQFPGACEGASGVLKNCSNKVEAMRSCFDILNASKETTLCLLKRNCDIMELFKDCVTFVCNDYGGGIACNNLGAAIGGCKSLVIKDKLKEKNCTRWTDPKFTDERSP